MEGATAGGAAPPKVNWEDIQLVQKLIERCLELYMSQQEIVTALKMQANIEPGLTNLGARARPTAALRSTRRPIVFRGVCWRRRGAAARLLPAWHCPRALSTTQSSSAALPARPVTPRAVSSPAVWEKLQEQNPDFFRAYRTRLRVKGQIREFNALVSKMSSDPPGTHPSGAAGGGAAVSNA